MIGVSLYYSNDGVLFESSILEFHTPVSTFKFRLETQSLVLSLSSPSENHSMERHDKRVDTPLFIYVRSIHTTFLMGSISVIVCQIMKCFSPQSIVKLKGIFLIFD